MINDNPPPLQTCYPLNSLQFLPCPDEETFAQTWRNTHPEWGTQFSMDEWVAMGKEMMKSNLVEPGWYELFVVTSKEDPAQNVLSSCAIFLVDAMVGYTSTTSGDGGCGAKEDQQQQHQQEAGAAARVVFRNVKCATAVRVVTPVPYRGCGYGGWMMKQLWQYLEQRPDIQLSNLYSDVGDYYTRKGGWRSFRSDVIRIPVHEFDPIAAAGGGSGVVDLPSVELISDEQLDNAIEQDVHLAKQLIQEKCQKHLDQHLQTTKHDGVNTIQEKTVVAIRPHVRQIRWNRLRKEYDLALAKRKGLLDQSVQLGAHGAMLRRPSSSLSSSVTTTIDQLQSLHHILWSQDIFDRRLRIHRFCHGTTLDSTKDRVETIALLQAAIDDAKRLKANTTEIWNPHPSLQEWLGCKAVTRSIALSNLGFCSGPSDSSMESGAEDKIPSSNVEWIFNEFYPCL
ncbi:hypothetical protein BGW42_003726 [Actinomortierella wolfii]|nr:hypothetical protein BGW42_003726 [Actinomortierella wolfii]